MDILYKPEKGQCSHCGYKGIIRGFTWNGKYSNVCFACWNAHQDPFVISSNEWEDDTNYVFDLKKKKLKKAS